MKRFVKKILGGNSVRIIRKFFPSKVQRELSKKEAVETENRADFYSNFVKNKDLCFDVGANLGNRISPLLKLGARIVAVEPQENCYTYLKEKFGGKIELITKGLGDVEGIKEFYISNGSPMSSFSTEWIESVKNERFKDYKWEPPILIEITTLDRLIAQYGLPEFIKIDVEGYELEVLKGLTQPVKMISFEYTVPELADNAINCIERIEAINSDIECNYSIGESMAFALKKWIPPFEMKKDILSKNFIDTDFGDIYIRHAVK